MKTLFVLFLGAALGIAAYLYFREPQNKPTMEQAGDKVSEGADKLKKKWNEKVPSMNTDDIRDELSKSGRVVRKKASEAGAAIADAAADSSVTTEVKSKLALDKELSAVKISVNTTKGVVTLSGSVSSHELIKKAMDIALEPQGASEVISTLQVEP